MPFPLSEIQAMPVGPNARPHELTRFGSTRGTAPLVLTAPLSAVSAKRNVVSTLWRTGLATTGAAGAESAPPSLLPLKLCVLGGIGSPLEEHASMAAAIAGAP